LKREKYHYSKGNLFSGVRIFAGYGSSPYKEYRDARYRADEYGGDVDKWFHALGFVTIVENDIKRRAEVHWAECDGIGAVMRDIK